MRRCPQADNPAQQRREAGGNLQFAALGACFVRRVFVELSEALAESVLGLLEQERRVGGDSGQSAAACMDDGIAPEGEGDGLWFGQVWEVGVEGAVKWSHSFGESLLFLVHGVDYIPLGDGSLFVCGGRGYPPKKTYPFKLYPSPTAWKRGGVRAEKRALPAHGEPKRCCLIIPITAVGIGICRSHHPPPV